MKKTYILLILAVIVGLFFTASCKRKGVSDPDMNRPSDFRISLKGTANPSTLYVPAGQPAVDSLIEVTAINNDGSPARNKEIIFQCGAYGYFEGYTLSTRRWTNDIGKAQIYYYIAPGTDVRMDTQIYISATLADAGRTDSVGSQIYDMIPLIIIPYEQNYAIRISGRVVNAASLQPVEGVIIELSTGEVTLTRATGKYWFTLPYGWTGTILPQKLGSEFVPNQLVHTEPVYYDLTEENFLELSVNSLTSDVNAVDFGIGGGSATVFIFVTPDINVAADVLVNCSVGWAQVGISSTGPWTNSINGITPFFIYIHVDVNATTQEREAIITVIATNPSNMSGSPLAITITQEGT